MGNAPPSAEETAPLKKEPEKPKRPTDNTVEGMKSTEPTDIFCLLVFLAYIGGVVYCLHYAFQNGDPRRLTHGFDYAGNLCGVDANVSDMPYLFWCGGDGVRVGGLPTTLNFEDPICIQSCPKGTVTIPDNIINSVVLGQSVPTTTAAPNSTAAPHSTVAPPATTSVTAPPATTAQVVVPTTATTPPTTVTVAVPVSTSSALAAAAASAPTAVPQRRLENASIVTTSAPSDAMPYFHCPMPAHTIEQVTGTWPDVTKVTTITQETVKQQAYPTKIFMGQYCVPDVPATSMIMQQMLNGTKLGDGLNEFLTALGGCKKAWPVIAGSCGVALLLCFAYLLFLRTCAYYLIYGALVTLTVGFAVVGLALLSTSQDWTGNQDKSPLFQRLPHDDAVLYSEIGAGCCFVGFFTFVVLLFCFGGLIQKALGCVEAACEVMFSELDMLISPIVDVIVRLSVFTCLVIGFVWLLSVGNVKPDHDATIGGQTVAGVSRSIQYTEDEQYMILFYIFGCFWIMETFNAMAQFVISYMVVLWYYTEKSENGSKKMVFCALLKGYGAGFCHLGTLCMGAFLISVCRFISMILNFIAKQADATGNYALSCMAKGCMCCVDCFKRFLEYINKNAYIDVAISSNNFCVAAKNSFEFLAKEAPTIALLNGACFVFFWAGVGLVSGVCGYGGYAAVLGVEDYNDNASENYVAYPEVVGVACGLFALVISICFMNVFDQAADTLLYCYAWNTKKDKAGVHFYAPDSLAKLAKEG